jgi:hypothetical protein
MHVLTMRIFHTFLATMLVILSSGCADENERGVAKFEVVWQKKFSSLDALMAQSWLGVHGIVVAASPPYMPGKGTVVPEEFLQNKSPHVQTDYTVRVIQVLTGQLSLPQDIVVTQVGASIQGISYEIRSDPLYGVGEEVVVFLTDDVRPPFNSPGYSTAKQFVVNQTAEARFRVRDGVVYPISTEFRLPDVPMSGVPLTDFLARVSSVERSPLGRPTP